MQVTGADGIRRAIRDGGRDDGMCTVLKGGSSDDGAFMPRRAGKVEAVQPRGGMVAARGRDPDASRNVGQGQHRGRTSVIQTQRRSFIVGATVLAAGAGLAPARAQAPAPAAGPFKLDPLPYPAAKNEPHVDARTMELHHGAHHQAYVNNLNAAVAPHAELAKMPIKDLLANLSKVPEAARSAVRNNGGGHANHTMFWQIMGGSGGEPAGELKSAVERDFGSVAKMQDEFNGAGGRHFGSGWVFVTAARDGKLALVTKPNQDTPLMDGATVLFGNDLWEHAFYLKYQNKKPDYLKAWWNVVNWDKVGERYAAAKAGTLAV